MAQMVKHLPAMWETWVRSLGWEDFLEKEMEPTPVFLPGESQGQGSLVGCRLWGLTESDTTEATQQQQQQHTVLVFFFLAYFTLYNRLQF